MSCVKHETSVLIGYFPAKLMAKLNVAFMDITAFGDAKTIQCVYARG